jgi:hypothetical protein
MPRHCRSFFRQFCGNSLHRFAKPESLCVSVRSASLRVVPRLSFDLRRYLHAWHATLRILGEDRIAFRAGDVLHCARPIVGRDGPYCRVHLLMRGISKFPATDCSQRRIEEGARKSSAPFREGEERTRIILTTMTTEKTSCRGRQC